MRVPIHVIPRCIDPTVFDGVERPDPFPAEAAARSPLAVRLPAHARKVGEPPAQGVRRAHRAGRSGRDAHARRRRTGSRRVPRRGARARHRASHVLSRRAVARRHQRLVPARRRFRVRVAFRDVRAGHRRGALVGAARRGFRGRHGRLAADRQRPDRHSRAARDRTSERRTGASPAKLRRFCASRRGDTRSGRPRGVSPASVRASAAPFAATTRPSSRRASIACARVTARAIAPSFPSLAGPRCTPRPRRSARCARPPSSTETVRRQPGWDDIELVRTELAGARRRPRGSTRRNVPRRRRHSPRGRERPRTRSRRQRCSP